MENIGTTAKRLREKFGLTQAQLADKIGITAIQISKIERGTSKPSAETLQRYRDVFGVDLYVFHWCEHGNNDDLPVAVREAANGLLQTWQSDIDARLP